MSNPVYRRRLWTHRIGIALSVLAMAFGIAFLGWILATLLIKGFGAIDPAIFLADTPPPGGGG
ncbi:MAG: phosphate ABC transporter permease PstA, partial [Burkholderiaceae bacterium]